MRVARALPSSIRLSLAIVTRSWGETTESWGDVRTTQRYLLATVAHHQTAPV